MRLIDADELNKELSLTRFDWTKVINNMPTIDPESLRPHGRWLTKEYVYDENGDYWKEMPAKYGDSAYCSECKEYALLDGSETDCLSDYCPHCGAIMDLQEQKGEDLT